MAGGPRGRRTANRGPRTSKGRSRVGERFEGEVGPIAHGGHCVVRVVDGDARRVVFTRHAIPGERVIVEITEGGDGDRFWRGDAVEVLAAAPDRVTAPCRFAGPGGCGGCDFQHVSLEAQRAFKADVVREQLIRLGGLAADDERVTGLTVEAVPGDDHGLRWRTRQRYVELPGGRRGMRQHRSHEVVEIDECLIEAPQRPDHVVRGTAFEVADDGFWQVHPGAPEVLVDTVLAMVAPQPGERVLDLYAGVGLFARFLGEAVGDPRRVTAVEGDVVATRCARRNLPGSRVVTGDVAAVLRADLDEPFDVVVLDPPRSGAKREVVEQVIARAPRAVAYVACDPAALGRDVAIFEAAGYRLSQVRAFDLFPMTHHVECVALLTKTGSDLR